MIAMAAIVSKKPIALFWRVISVVAGLIALVLTAVYVWVDRMHTVALTGCTPTKQIACIAEVSVDPQSAIVIAGLVLSAYFAVTGIGGQVLTLKIGDNAIGQFEQTKATEATQGQKDKASEPVEPQSALDNDADVGDKERVRERSLRRGTQRVPDPVQTSLPLYRALPADIRLAADALWDQWGYGDTPLAVSIQSANKEPGHGQRPYVITARLPGDAKTRSIRISKDARAKSTVTLREADGVRVITG